jgi:hypothetical protein
MSDTAKILKLDGFPEERSLVHMVQFVGGYSVGWRFCLREELREMLDIKPAERVGLNPAERSLFQGKQYCFSAGHLIYDSREAYELQWGEALRVVRYAVQVISAIPAAYLKTRECKTLAPVQLLEDGKPSAEPWTIEYTRRRLSYGEVEMSLMKNKDGSGLAEVGRFRTDQEKFVAFLQTGILRDFSGAVLSTECAANR